jgi:ribosomal protein S12 methylthiotransferase accessory factor
MQRSRLPELELRDVPRSDPRETVKLAKYLISPKVGMVRSLNQGAFRAQDPITLAMGVAAADLSRFADIPNSGKAGGGGETIASAVAATIGELVERYCMLFYDKAEMVLAPWREVADDAVHPDLVRFFSRQQTDRGGPEMRGYFDEDTPIYWVWGTALGSGRPRLVPACQVYLNYRFDEGEGSPGRNASTGLAAGATLEEAILSGLFEVIERDAFAVCWLHRKVGPRIRIDDPELSATLRHRFHAGHPAVDLQFFDITLDIPVLSVFSVMRRPAEFGPALVLSSVSRLSPREVIVKCLREMGQTMPYLRFLRNNLKNWEPASDWSDITSFDHHFLLYSKHPELIDEAMSFCAEADEEVAFSDLPDPSTGRVLGDIEHCVRLLDERGLEAIVVDITVPEIRDLGLHVVRVLIPGLVPLHGNHNARFLGVPRLYELPSKLNWAAGGWDSSAGINPYPHPFP